MSRNLRDPHLKLIQSADDDFWRHFMPKGTFLGIIYVSCLTQAVNFVLVPCPQTSKLCFYINTSRDSHTRSSVLLNVWMTSHHHGIKSRQWRTVQFLAPLLSLTAASICCSSQETMSLLSRPINHADEFMRPACVSNYLPSLLTLPLSSTSLFPHVCVFCISNHPYSIHSRSPSLREG